MAKKYDAIQFGSQEKTTVNAQIEIKLMIVLETSAKKKTICSSYRPLQHGGKMLLNWHTVKSVSLNPQAQKIYNTP